ncbi:MAG TPA: phosphoribosylamine--glycine ligase [Longimicrobiaceae bacterium]|nr:phosphoribosylamine--glycine ligase [Longimicrobiaceae bacterium]
MGTSGGRVLLVDRSGRGHAYAELFSRTRPDATVFYAPGCSAITTERVVSVPHLSLSDPLPLVEFARREEVDFVFVANAVALTGGFVDVFREHGIPVIGPDRAASRLEASKSYTKDLCRHYGVRVAEYAWFDDPEEARGYVRAVPYAVVVKAEGLCGGNGSFVCDTAEDAVRAIDTLMVERRLHGREISFFTLLDGRGGHLHLPLALDYPKSDDANRGVTCGGMGAISPHPLEDARLLEEYEDRILAPLKECIRGEGLRYTGVVYVGSMLTDEGPYLLEVNVRLGDPEAEAVLPRVESDFFGVCRAVLDGTLADHPSLRVSDLYTCVVTLAQGRTRHLSRGRNKGWYVGWPYGRYGKGYPITGIERVDPARCRVFLGEAEVHPEKGLVSDGGRVVHVVGLGATRREAVENAYANVGHVHFEGMRYRSDIGRVLPWTEPALSAGT